MCVTLTARPSCQFPIAALRSSDQLVPSLLYCCDCKQPRVVELSLGSLQRLVKHNLLAKVSWAVRCSVLQRQLWWMVHAVGV